MNTSTYMTKIRILKYFFLILSLSLIKCIGSDFKNIRIKNESELNMIQEAIVIKTMDFDSDSLVYTPMIGVKVYKYFPTFNDERENRKESDLFFSSTYHLNENKPVFIKLPKGEYFAKIQIIDTRIYPFITTVHSDINIYFGYYINKKAEYLKFDSDECVILESSSLEVNEKIVCPILKINEIDKLELIFFQKDMKLNGGATGLPWVAAILVSLQTVSPFGLLVPIIMGPIGFEKKIKNPFGDLKKIPFE